MSIPNCKFCDLLAGKLPISQVYRDELCTALMDIQPVNPGHMIIVPNAHAAFLSELNEDTGAHMFCIAQQLAAALRRSAVNCEGVNFFLADGEAAFQEVFHVHLHVFPRFVGDGFGLTFGPAYAHKPPRDELDQVAAQIRSVLA
jgi:histidine triad (HIT) family protein